MEYFKLVTLRFKSSSKNILIRFPHKALITLYGIIP